MLEIHLDPRFIYSGTISLRDGVTNGHDALLDLVTDVEFLDAYRRAVRTHIRNQDSVQCRECDDALTEDDEAMLFGSDVFDPSCFQSAYRRLKGTLSPQQRAFYERLFTAMDTEKDAHP